MRESAYERWDGNGALGYLTLAAIVEAQLASPPAAARLVVAQRCFPTGMLGYWARRLADGGLVAALTATSPPRLAHPDGGPTLVGTNPLAIAIPSSDGKPVVADVSMGEVTYGDVIAGTALGRSSSSRSAASTRTRRSHSLSGCSCSSTRSWPSPVTARCCSSPGRRRTRCRRYEPAPLVLDCPVIARKRGSSNTGAKSSSCGAYFATTAGSISAARSSRSRAASVFPIRISKHA